MDHAVEKTKQAEAKASSASRRGLEAAAEQASLHPVMQLQRQAGNQAVQQLLRSGVIQAKLAVGQYDSPEEHEADRVAEQVTAMPGPHAAVNPLVSATGSGLQRKCDCGGSCADCQGEYPDREQVQ